MSLLSKKALVLLLAAATGLGALNAQAAKATSSDAPAQKVSMLGSKFTFNLPTAGQPGRCQWHPVQQCDHQDRGDRR
jgi:hypothetical protein